MSAITRVIRSLGLDGEKAETLRAAFAAENEASAQAERERIEALARARDDKLAELAVQRGLAAEYRNLPDLQFSGLRLAPKTYDEGTFYRLVGDINNPILVEGVMREAKAFGLTIEKRKFKGVRGDEYRYVADVIDVKAAIVNNGFYMDQQREIPTLSLKPKTQFIFSPRPKG